MHSFNVAVIAGDGIGKEVIPEGIRVLEVAGRRFNFQFVWREFDWSCEKYLQSGIMMPPNGLQELAKSDAIFLGAVGDPRVPDHVSLWGLLIPIRRGFQQYVNLRPVRLFEGMDSPLKNWKPGDIDFRIVRENNEGEYSNIGGRLYEGTPHEMAVQQTVFTRRGWSAFCVSHLIFRAPAKSTSPPQPNPTASSTPCRSGMNAFIRLPPNILTCDPTNITSTS